MNFETTIQPASSSPQVHETDCDWRQAGRQRRKEEQEEKMTQAPTRPAFQRNGGIFFRGRGEKGRFSERGGRGTSSRNIHQTDELSRSLGALKINSDKDIGRATSKDCGKMIRPVQVIRNAHRDDIHGFLSISPEHFVSGSKDCTLKMWNIDGSFVKKLTPQIAREKSHSGYKFWITSLGKINNSLFASGTRDGQLTVWNNDGEERLSIFYNPSTEAKSQYICKDRNKTRINCITPIPQTDGVKFYTGTPKFVQLWDGPTKRLLNYTQASQNDWVYCIEVLENQNLLVVIGSDLEYWHTESAEPARSSLIREEDEPRSFQRHHISSIMRLEGNQNHLAAALFDGSVKVVDIEAQRLVRKYNEHENRVWSVINLNPELFASSADDRTIKIWDTRQERSITTIAGGPGRVSSLLKLSQNTFISGSCPDKVFESEEKAGISFWDIRQL